MNKLIILGAILLVISCSKEYNDNAGYDVRFGNDRQNELFQYAILPSVSKAYATKNVPGLGKKAWIGNGDLVFSNNKFNFYFETINNPKDKFL